MSILCKVGELSVPFDLWRPPELLEGRLVAVDTETALIKPGAVPPMVLATATDGLRGFFIARQSLNAFVTAHEHKVSTFHNAAFDLAVMEQAGVNTARLVEAGRVFDTGLLYRLLKLADTGSCHGPWSLDHACHDLLKITLPKDVRAGDGQNIRTSFGRFLNADGTPDYKMLLQPEFRPYLSYAGCDAVATVLLANALNAWAKRLFGADRLNIFDPSTYSAAGVQDGVELAPAWKQHGFLTHDIQLKASISLATIERNGMYLDTEKVLAAVNVLDTGLGTVREQLKSKGWAPGKGSLASLDRILSGEEKALGETFTRTECGSFSRSGEHLEEFRGRSKFIDLYLKHEELNKIRSVFMAPLIKAERVVRGHFNVLVNTGRTSCSGTHNDDGDRVGLNLQNLPRAGQVRESFCASPGYLLLACDYSTIELVTLAQHALKKYRWSRMADAIKKNADLHCVYAAHRLGIDISNLASWDKKTLMPLLGPEGDKQRDRAKPVNFGYPGGLGAESLVDYARTSYGVTLNTEEAKQEKEHWLNSWPEMKSHLASDDLQMLAKNFPQLWQSYPDLKFPLNPMELPWPIHILRGVLCGRTSTCTKNRPYRANEIDWAWTTAAQIVQQSSHIAEGQRAVIETRIRERITGNELWSTLIPRQRFVATQTGRLRGYPTYCAARNCVFQGLAADGAKLALYRLHRKGFRVVNFIHDEALVELPVEANHTVMAERVRTIMVEEMRVVVPDLPVSCEFALMRRWYKGAKPMYVDGQLVPVKPEYGPETGTMWVRDCLPIIESVAS